MGRLDQATVLVESDVEGSPPRCCKQLTPWQFCSGDLLVSSSGGSSTHDSLCKSGLFDARQGLPNETGCKSRTQTRGPRRSVSVIQQFRWGSCLLFSFVFCFVIFRFMYFMLLLFVFVYFCIYLVCVIVTFVGMYRPHQRSDARSSDAHPRSPAPPLSVVLRKYCVYLLLYFLFMLVFFFCNYLSLLFLFFVKTHIVVICYT